MGAHNNIFKQITKILERANVEAISERTRIDEFSKKLTLFQHALIMIWHVLSDCEGLRELCGSLKGEISRNYGLI